MSGFLTSGSYLPTLTVWYAVARDGRLPASAGQASCDPISRDCMRRDRLPHLGFITATILRPRTRFSAHWAEVHYCRGTAGITASSSESLLALVNFLGGTAPYAVPHRPICFLCFFAILQNRASGKLGQTPPSEAAQHLPNARLLAM